MLLKYFFEIKNRFILLSIGWLIYTCIAYLNKETLLYVIVKTNINNNFISTNVTDVFGCYLQIIYFTSFHLLVFLGVYHFSTFVYPALYSFEKKKLKDLIFLVFFFWFLSLFLFNLVILPFCWKFFLSFQQNSSKVVDIFFEAKITEYLETYFTVYFITILSLQFFVVIYLILSVLNKKLLLIKKTRKIFYLKFFIIATLLTPPDVISQLIVGSFFLAIYELIIVINIIKLF